MMLESERMLLKPVQGQVYRYNETATRNGRPIYQPIPDISEILTLDGFGSRLVISINRQFPGPELRAYEGQMMIVHVRNFMHTDSTTIHWHGIHQKNSALFDGVAFVTQCPILPGEYYTYRFKLTQYGTYFYHAHIGDQRSMGLYGPFIVLPDSDQPVLKEHTVIIQDWNHSDDPETLYQRMLFGTYDLTSNTRIDPSISVDKTQFSRFVFHSGVINGRGRYYISKTVHNEAPLQQYEVERNQSYRMRVISAATLYPFRVFVEGHPSISVVASDGFEFDPVNVESFIIQPGERYDFILTANQTQGYYVLVAESLEQNTKTYHAAEAIIRYTTGGTLSPINARKATYNICAGKCKVLNCPFSYYPANSGLECVSMNSLSLSSSDFNSTVRYGTINEMFFNFAFPGEAGYTPGSVNGRQFIPPIAPILSQPGASETTSCDRKECGDDTICECSYSREISSNQIYQFVMTNIGVGRGWSHPIHLHGHSFFIMKIGFGNYSALDASYLNDTSDIRCYGNRQYCNRARWTSAIETGNNVADINLLNPILKDTVIVPSGGYVVIRFKADNPGPWFFHCHIDLHNTNGMGMVILESISLYPNVSKNYPKCGVFEGKDFL